jgi:hypothetical protein
MSSSHDDQTGVDDLFAQIVAGIEPDDTRDEGYLVRVGDRIENRLPVPARDVLVVLAGLIRDSVELETVPVVYDDPADQAAYELLAGAALHDELAEACRAVQRSAMAETVAPDELEAWLRVTNTLRARLTAGVTSEQDMEQLWADGGERAQLLGFVAAVQREVLDVLLG